MFKSNIKSNTKIFFLVFYLVLIYYIINLFLWFFLPQTPVICSIGVLSCGKDLFFGIFSALFLIPVELILFVLSIITPDFAPFFWIFLGIIILLIGITYLFTKLSFIKRVITSKKDILNFISSIIGGTLFLQWITILISEIQLPSMSATSQTAAYAGFPFIVFIYPGPAMGSNYVPLSMWPPFYYNLIIFFIFGSILGILFAKKITKHPVFIQFLTFVGIILTIIGIVRVAGRFD